jgi:hypothetical protein
MRHTLTAVFDDRGDAQHALNKLLAAGYLRADAILSPAGKRHVITLTTESDPEAERAVALVGRLIPADPRQTTVRSKDDKIAAYRYGNEMRTSDKYRNRSWNEVNDDLRSEWESRNPGVSNWDASEPVIRSGWEATTPDIDEDSYYRTHWNARYAHDARGPGGHALAAVNLEEASHGFPYRIRHWAAAAAELKAGRALDHAGELSPWERFKDALFHGWSRINLGNGETESAAASTDDLAPAYRFGDEMHHTDRFRSRGWNEAENALHEDSDSRYGGRGLATWDKNKVAVRSGWDRTKSTA